MNPAVGYERIERELQDRVNQAALRLRVPGVAAGIEMDGRSVYAYRGITSIENPMPVDSRTLFQIGSNTKTFTATVAMRLAEKGKLDLRAPVRRYLPELRLRDKRVLQHVTVQQLLNHTAGWTGDAFADTGAGDDALSRYVDYMREVPQESPLGARVSYNNASFSLVGRIIEKITGSVFETAVRNLVIDPLQLTDTRFPPADTMVRRFAVGHFAGKDGVEVAQRWLLARSVSAAGTLCSTPSDMLRYARFHLAGDAPRRGRVLGAKSRRLMRRVTAVCKGSALGDAIGISWLVRDLGGVTMVGHGGGTNGQISLFQTVPERGFAIVVLTNASTGGELNAEVLDWALERCLGISPERVEPARLSKRARQRYAGTYTRAGVTFTVEPEAEQFKLTTALDDAGWVWARAFAGDQAALATPPPMTIEVLADDRFRVAGSPRAAGTFVRERGAIAGISLGGRFAKRDGLADA